jgi:hypothetical protein
MTSPTAPLRVAFYHRIARDPALEDSRADKAQAESVRRYLERFAPLDIVVDDDRACALRPAANRFAFYARIAADLPTSQRRIARHWQYTLCDRIAHRRGAVLTATFFDPATPASTPFHRRKGGAALLAAGADFDGVIVANLARIGTGTESLADAGLTVVVADLDTVIAPDGWDGPLAQILTGIGGGA